MNYTKESADAYKKQEIKKTLTTLKKIIRKEFGKKCKERSPLCCVCVAYQCVEDLTELMR